MTASEPGCEPGLGPDLGSATDHVEGTDVGTGPEVDPTAPRRQAAVAPWWAAPLAGLVAAAVAMWSGSLVAALVDVDSPFESVGNEFIDRAPSGLKDLAVDWFGATKPPLRVGMALTIALLGVVVGVLARRRRVAGATVLVAFGAFGAAVAAGRPDQGAIAALPPLVGAATGAALLWWTIGLVRAADPAHPMPRPDRRGDFDRRRFVVATGGAATAGLVAAATARMLERERLDELVDAAPDTLPALAPPGAAGLPAEVSSAAPEIPPSATLSPLTPYLTPNDDFYLIDTALSVPRVRLDRWALEIGGRVDRPLRLTYDDLLARPQVERIVTIACVSNEVGGDLIGNAVWQGVLLRDLLDEAGAQPGAEQVFGTSVDGWTCGFPVEAAVDGRDAMIAIGMNGEPLPARHGFPARVIVPGLYGYVSATKWVARLDLTTWDEAEGYWIPRGWAREAPIKTQSRIDVPRRGEEVGPGVVAVAGVAWAQHRGIATVEVRVDDGDWQEARLAPDVTVDSWRQWVFEWDTSTVEPGEHRLQVRATDATGEVQTDEVSRPDPDGATGHHTRTVRVRG